MKVQLRPNESATCICGTAATKVQLRWEQSATCICGNMGESESVRTIDFVNGGGLCHWFGE